MGVVALLYVIAVWTPIGQSVDSQLMGTGFYPVNQWVSIDSLQVLRTGSLYVLTVLVFVLSVRALWRRRWSAVLRCVLVIGLAASGSTWLRRTLPRPDLGDPTYPYNTWPSGHAAIATALIVAAVILAPDWPVARLRTTAVVTVVIVGGASIATYAHRPSDVLASILLVAAITAALFPWRQATGPAEPSLVTKRSWLVVGVAVVFTLVPGLSELGLVANTAWLLAMGAVAVECGIRGRARTTD